MALTDLSRCSAAARDRGEPLAGTAPVASRWLLVEHQGPWAKEPLATPPLVGVLGREIEARCASYGAKVLLVRRPGRRLDDEGLPGWWAVDTVRRTWVRGTWQHPDDLLGAADALGGDLTFGDEDAEPMVLVCTHGTRDACCAVRGRPVVAALARQWPDRVWECTHLGGHRFAGTLLVLPAGTCYGTVDADLAVDLVTADLEGRVPASHLRGVTRYEPAVQAAVAAALREHGPAAVEDAEPSRVERDGDRTVVELVGSGPLPDRVVVEVTVERLPDAPLSCGAGPKPHVAHRTVVRPA